MDNVYSGLRTTLMNMCGSAGDVVLKPVFTEHMVTAQTCCRTAKRVCAFSSDVIPKPFCTAII